MNEMLNEPHPLLRKVSAEKMLRAFEGPGSMPFTLRYGRDTADMQKIRCSVNYARLVESGRRTPEVAVHAERAKQFLAEALTENPPNPGWSVWGHPDLAVQSYTTSKVLYGLGRQGVGSLLHDHLEVAVSFLTARTHAYSTPGSSDHPILALLGLQSLHELGRAPESLVLQVVQWADRLLYSAEAHLSRGRMSPIPPNHLLLVLGVLLHVMPDVVDDERLDRLLNFVNEATGSLPAFSPASVIRVADYAIGSSSLDVLMYILESERGRTALLKCDALLSRSFDWLAAHEVRVGDGVHLYRSDLYQGPLDIDLWFNCAVVDLVGAYKQCILAQDRRRLLVSLSAEPPLAAYAWSHLKVGGFRWVDELEKRLLKPARDRLGHGEKLEQNGIILFGPPGTSKTSVAESIAKGLGDWPIVRLGPGHFLQEGPDRVFAMIDKHFRTLTRLPKAVLLFDEFDLFVLDRKRSSPYASWLAGLTTDAMVPWFKALHDWGRNVYILATNDVESIDGAIRSARRFDFVLPVGPPSVPERLHLLVTILGPSLLDCEALNRMIDERATIGEVVQWAHAVKEANLGIEAAVQFWSRDFSQSLQIDQNQHQKFLRMAQERTFPASMK